MEFWNDLLTEKSFNLLKDLTKKNFRFILIGGWAAYLWTKTHKSKDIDIILPDFASLDYLKKHYELKKNDTLKKYEIVFGEIDLDIYIPFYSKLTLPTEEIIKYTTTIENIEVVTPEMLLILKQGAEKERTHSVKGMKDRVDILTLLFFANVDIKKYKEIVKHYHLGGCKDQLKKILLEFKELTYLGLNPREFKLKKEHALKELKITPENYK